MKEKNMMHNPPHPGEFIREVFLIPLGLSHRDLAKSMHVSPSTVNRLLNEKSGVSPEMAIRLSRALGRTPQSWLSMQNNHDLFNLERNPDMSSINMVERINA